MKGRFALMLAAVSMLVGCDHTTKHLAETALSNQSPLVLVPGVLDLSYVRNHDVAFNLLRSVPDGWRAPMLTLVGAIAVIALSAWLIARRRGPWPESLAIGSLLAGALGNTADRVLRGYVVDFIHVHRWPVFNVADVLIVVGVGLLLLSRQSAKPITA